MSCSFCGRKMDEEGRMCSSCTREIAQLPPAEDDSELEFAIGHDETKSLMVINFGRSVSWVAFNKVSAEKFIRQLQEACGKIA